MLPKHGNSNTYDRIDIVNQYIKLFGRDTIANLITDCEFVGEELTECLNKERIEFKKTQ
jgi:hypothetical protein